MWQHVFLSSFRGRYNGLSHTTGSIAGIVTTAIGGWILATQPAPMSFGYLFLIAWLISTLGWSAGLFAREKKVDTEKVPLAWSKDMVNSVIHNVPYMRIIIVGFFSGVLFNGGGAFMQQYAYKELELPNYNAAIFQYITMIGRLVVAIPIGLIIDKYGPKRFYPYWGVITAFGLAFPIFLQNRWGHLYIHAQSSNFNGVVYNVEINPSRKFAKT